MNVQAPPQPKLLLLKVPSELALQVSPEQVAFWLLQIVISDLNVPHQENSL